MTKHQAIKEITSRCYVKTGEGQCGDGPYGSRIYFEHATAPANEHGNKPMATASKLGCKWRNTYFGDVK